MLIPVAAGLVILASVLLPEARVAESRVAACRQNPTPVCLTDLGSDLAMTEKKLPAYMKEVDWLARLGRLEAAHALQQRAQIDQGKSAKEARIDADRRLASHRLAAALRSGMPLDKAIRQAPGLDAGDAWIAAFDLLGRSPYGDPPDIPRTPVGDLAVLLGEMALRIEDLAQNDPQGPSAYQFVYAAEVYAIVGDRDAALAALSRFPENQPGVIVFSEALIRAVGSGPALAAYERSGATNPSVLLTAALAEDDASSAAAFLRRAFEAYMAEKPWPDFGWMETAVQRAVEAGQAEVALELARRMAETARDFKYPFQVFAHIHSAKALLAAGAPTEEVRAGIGAALGLFPEDENQYIATGVHMGPIRWESSGLGAQARRNIAALLLQLDNVEAARRILEGPEKDKIFTWLGVLDPAIAPRHYDEILTWAREALGKDEFAYLRASFAASVMHAASSDDRRRWAVETAQDLLGGRPVHGRLGAETYSNLIRVADLAGNPRLKQAALATLSDVALDDLNYSILIRAGIERHLSAVEN